MKMIIRLVILFAVIILLEFYAFQAIKTISKNKIIRFAWLFISVAVYANFLYVALTYDRGQGQTPQFQMAMGLLLTVLIPKIIVLLFMFGEDIYRWFLMLISAISSENTKPLASRRKFISQLALGLAAIPFASFIYGIIQGKYNYKVLKYQLSFKDLPDAFDGFTITQISDIHSGSFTNKEKLNTA